MTTGVGKTFDCRSIGLNQWTNTGTITENGIIRRWASGLAFTNSTGQSLTAVTPGDGIYITCLDEDGNLNASAPDTLQVTVQSLTTNDSQVVTLTETGNATMTFRNTTPLATATGAAVAGDSIIQMQALENLRATYTDSKDTPDTITYLLFDSPIPALTSSASATATVGQAFSFLVTAINSPWTFGATGLPAPLTINSSTGQISGTPTTAGSYPVTLTATNPAGTGTQNFTLTVNPAAPVVTSSLSATAVQGTAITTYQITASHSPTSFSASGLPAGLSVNTTTGAITGTPSVSGSFSVTLGATNVSGTGTATLNLLVHPPAPVISSSLTASGTVGVAFTYQITASNTPTGFAASGLPAGLSFNAGSGVISGTPTVAGISSVSLTATNGGGSGTATLVLSIGAGPAAITTVTPTNGSTAGGTVLTITGINLATTTGVTVGGVAATTLLIDSPTQIRCTTPAGTAGTVDVVVTTTSGNAVAAAIFTYQTPAPSAPVISSVSPASGPVAGGTLLTLSGQNFTGATAVTIAGSGVAFTVVGATTITCTTAAHAAGAVDVVVTTPAGSTTATAAFTFVDPAAAPEADLARSGTPLASGGTDALGALTLNQASVVTYTLANTGTAVLNTGGSLAVSSLNGCTVSVTTLPPTAILAGNQATCAVSITPTAATWSAVLALATDDSNENPYTWTISGTAATAPSPEIAVQRGATAIAAGGSDVVAGTVAGTVTSLTYTISNIGTALLSVVPPSPVLGNVQGCTVDSFTAPAATIAAGGSSDLVINLRPTGSGPWSLQVVVGYDDADEYPYIWVISGTASAASTPELDLSRGATAVADGGSDALGATGLAGVAVPVSYTLANTGAGAMTISGSPALSALVNCTAAVTTAPAATVAAGATDSCDLSITPTAGGAWSVQVSIASDDADENPYTWTVSGTASSGPMPELDLARGATPIADAGSDAVGLVANGSATTLTYTLSNTGAVGLGIDSAVTIGALANCSVAVTGVPAISVVGGGNTTLAVAVTPSGTPWSFTIAVTSTDPDESPYQWTVSGTAAAGVAPELELARGAMVLSDASTDVLAGTVAGSATSLTYTLRNLGDSLLAILGAPVISATTNCTAVVTTAPASSIAASGTSDLVLTITPTAAGAWAVAVAVVNSDADENPYEWSIEGTAAAAPAPELSVRRGVTAIADGAADDLDSVIGTAAGAGSNVAYTLENLGDAALGLLGAPVIGPGTNCSVVAVGISPAQIAVGGTWTLQLVVTPTAAGPWSCPISVVSNDADENPYDWTISGTAGAASAPEFDLSRGASPIADGGGDSLAGLVAGSVTPVTYTITNSGSSSLSIQGAPAISALSNCTVAVTTNPAASIASGATSNLTLTITPSAAGAWSVTVAVANTDSNESPYDWTISGTATLAPAPELDVLIGATPLPSGGSDVRASSQVGVAVSASYTVLNTGSAILTLDGPVSLNSLVHCTAAVTSGPGATIATGSGASLIIAIVPDAVGAWTCSVVIGSDDADEDPYIWTISGTATAAASATGADGTATSTSNSGGPTCGAGGAVGLLLVSLAALGLRRRNAGRRQA